MFVEVLSVYDFLSTPSKTFFKRKLSNLAAILKCRHVTTATKFGSECKTYFRHIFVTVTQSKCVHLSVYRQAMSGPQARVSAATDTVLALEEYFDLRGDHKLSGRMYKDDSPKG